MHNIVYFRSSIQQSKGVLSFFEINKDIPFEIKRIYYTYDVPVGTKRGMHTHKKLQQLLWCPYGEIEVVLDNGLEKKLFILDSPEKGLLVLQGFWRDMYWKKEGSVLCVAASDYYDEKESVHKEKKKYLNPEISRRNIGLWEKYPNQQEIFEIYKSLKEYCYEN